MTQQPIASSAAGVERPSKIGCAGDAADRRRRGSIAGLAGASYLTILLGLVTGPVTARVLGASGKGEVAAAVAYGGIATLLLSWGLPSAVTYMVSTGRSKPGELLGPVLRWALYGAVPAAGAGAALGLALGSFTGPGRVGVALLVALSPIAIVGLCVEAMIRGRGDLGTLTRARFIAVGIPAVGVVSLWLTGTLSVGSAVAATILGSLATFLYLRSRLGPTTRGHVPLAPLLSFGSRSLLASAAIAISGRLDQAVIAPLLGSRQLGIYAVAVTVSTLPLGLAYAVSNRAWGQIGRASLGKGGDVGALYVRRAIAAVLLATAPLAIVTPFAIPFLFGNEFRASVVPTLLLLPATLAAALIWAGETGLNALGYPGRGSLAQAAGTVIGVLALAAMIRPFGIAGAAVATTIDFGVTAAGIAFCLRGVGASTLLPGQSEFVELWGVGRTTVSSAFRSLRPSRRRSLTPPVDDED